MDNNKKFSKSFFGFSKKSVNGYILELTTELSQKISDLESKVKDYEEQIIQKDEKIAKLEAERTHVAETLLKARVESDELISSANAKAETLISNAKADADNITSEALEKSEKIVAAASLEAEELISNSKEEATQLKTASEKELSDLENQKNYVAQCISSLKLDVLSAYEVYMLKLEKSMGQNDVLPADENYIEVEHSAVEENNSESASDANKDNEIGNSNENDKPTDDLNDENETYEF